MSISAPGLMFPNKNKNLIVVTGGFGFIGSHVVQKLNVMGINDIIVIDDLTDGSKFSYLKNFEIKDYYDADSILYRDARDFPFSWADVRHIYHLGAISSTTETDGKKVMKYNYEFSRDLYNQARRYDIGFTFTSSASVYGNNESHAFSGFDEGHSTNPLNLYAYSKLLFEQYILGSNYKRTQVFRPFNVYGTNEDHKGNQASPITKFKKQVEETGTIEIFEGSDRIFRDFVYVGDVVRIILTFPKHVSGTFNIGTGVAVSFQHIAEQIAEKYNGSVSTIPFPEHLKGKYQYFTKANVTKLKKAFEAEHDTISFMPVEDYIWTYL